MISDFFIGLWSGFMDWGLGLFGTSDPPAYLTTVTTFISGLLQSAQGLGVWVPWVLVLSIAGINIGLWLVFTVVKGARWVLGLIPTMGGG
jgi:hypothetical protein